MEIGAAGQAQSILESEIKAEQARELYGVKLIKMAQESEAVVGNLIQDTVEISNEAMQKFMAERA